MLPLRNKIPQHRKDRDVCEHYSSYLKTLREDFNGRCGYCDDINSYRIRSFAIDHFVPRNPKDFVHTIKPNFYYNLVYACNYCNSSKSNKWPSKDPAIPNDGNIGFVNPTEQVYDNLFQRDKEGSIIPTNSSPLAVYIIEELNLKNPIHSLMWRFEKILDLEQQVSLRLKANPNQELKDQHYLLMLEVIEIVRNIFSDNEE